MSRRQEGYSKLDAVMNFKHLSTENENETMIILSTCVTMKSSLICRAQITVTQYERFLHTMQIFDAVSMFDRLKSFRLNDDRQPFKCVSSSKGQYLVCPPEKDNNKNIESVKK